jgi:Branched-chain amino acid transport system / permease component.
MSKALKQNKFKLSVDMLPAISRLCILIVIVLLGVGIDSSFLSLRNISNIFANASILIILGIGQTITVITNGPDLSSGSVMTICAVIAAILIKNYNVNFVIAILIALVVGGIIGAINGYMIAYVGIPSFISTYGLQWAIFGFAYVLLQGYVLYDFDEKFRFIGNGNLFGVIQMPILVTLICVLLGHLLLKKTTLGRKCYAVGSNRVSASMSGINVNTVISMAFVISGILSAFAGVLFVARMNSVQSDSGSSYLLPVLASVYMGGTSVSGGEGGVLGTVFGAMVMTVATNCMNLLSVPSEWRDAILGVLIIITVLLDVVVKKRMQSIKIVSA